VFASDYRVIAVDMRGHGQSRGTEQTEDDYSIDLFADDLDGLVEALGAKQLYLLCSSMGGILNHSLFYSCPITSIFDRTK
jgi:pimeloyl-ACP methyl ester carboxylesterase